ncbi:MAG: preprotein translocase subunit SecG [Chthonomonadales bacterium]|nr:preprotein translocase subunit SecG [Chthonomonadales bacterium]
MQVLHIILSVVQVALAVGLIFVVAIQQTKSEGLGGTIGGKATSTFKGKPGFEDRLNEMTRYISIGFFVASILVAVTMNRG